jgi:signal transduction histidine kinase
VSFRRRILVAFTVIVLISVVTVAWVALFVTRRAFEQAEGERASVLVGQFRREFDRRGKDVARRVQNIAAGEVAARMAAATAKTPPDYALFVNDAGNIASAQQLDFLEFVDADGTILSSAHRAASFGYKENAFSAKVTSGFVLRSVETSEGARLGLFAIAKVSSDGASLFVIGGTKFDRNFLSSIELPVGTRVLFSPNPNGAATNNNLIDPSGKTPDGSPLIPLLRKASQGKESSDNIHWSSNALDDESFHAIPLLDAQQQVSGVFLVGTSRRPYVELSRHIRSGAIVAAAAGLILAAFFSGWMATRVTRPVVELAEASREVAAGNMYAFASVNSSDELGELAKSFNQMTRELLDQRERLVQSERVAAWRELARRLAHELKNPLFPLQLTVENLLKAKQQSPELFEEIFQESSATLLAEIANLKTIVSRFSDFAKMPQPELKVVNVNEVVQNVARLFQAQCGETIQCKLNLATNLPSIQADPDLLHRALSNLFLNAMDAMPQGGVLTLTTHSEENLRVRISVADTGVGLTPEECERIFTPYYTSKTHGTGLGLAVVQSVISDHHGRITVSSKPGAGTTFVIELPVSALHSGEKGI